MTSRRPAASRWPIALTRSTSSVRGPKREQPVPLLPAHGGQPDSVGRIRRRLLLRERSRPAVRRAFPHTPLATIVTVPASDPLTSPRQILETRPCPPRVRREIQSGIARTGSRRAPKQNPPPTGRGGIRRQDRLRPSGATSQIRASEWLAGRLLAMNDRMVGYAARVLRERRGLTQGELVAACGVSQGSISNVAPHPPARAYAGAVTQFGSSRANVASGSDPCPNTWS